MAHMVCSLFYFATSPFTRSEWQIELPFDTCSLSLSLSLSLAVPSECTLINFFWQTSTTSTQLGQLGKMKISSLSWWMRDESSTAASSLPGSKVTLLHPRTNCSGTFANFRAKIFYSIHLSANWSSELLSQSNIINEEAVQRSPKTDNWRLRFAPTRSRRQLQFQIETFKQSEAYSSTRWKQLASSCDSPLFGNWSSSWT